jgi:hypothetical protein
VKFELYLDRLQSSQDGVRIRSEREYFVAVAKSTNASDADVRQDRELVSKAWNACKPIVDIDVRV